MAPPTTWYPQDMTPLRELELLLRPAGAGLFTVSTGKAEQVALAQRLYGVHRPEDIVPAWRDALGKLTSARVVVLGIPSDCGAGLVRGAAFGPQAIRTEMLRQRPDLAQWAAERGIVDLGDVPAIPQLLVDDMLSSEQLTAARLALYPQQEAETHDFPVSPLSIAERVLERVLTIHPHVRPFVLGGDHSVAFPVVAVLGRRYGPTLGIVQPDAHTDLLEQRLGIRLCFATWAFHANRLLAGPGRLVQVGIRASSKSQAFWEDSLGVRQLWAKEVLTKPADTVVEDIVEHLRKVGVEHVYFSNDIDGTDAAFAPSTGAPEPGGLAPDFVNRLIAALGSSFRLVGADLVEVAPSVGSAEDRQHTLSVAAGYAFASLEALLERSEHAG